MTDRSKGKQRNTTGEFSLTYAIASLATRTQHKHSDRYTVLPRLSGLQLSVPSRIRTPEVPVFLVMVASRISAKLVKVVALISNLAIGRQQYGRRVIFTSCSKKEEGAA